MDDERDFLKSVVMIVLLTACVLLAFKVRAYKDKQEQKETYNVEIYHDEDTGITYSILTDKLGDVIKADIIESRVESR